MCRHRIRLTLSHTHNTHTLSYLRRPLEWRRQPPQNVWKWLSQSLGKQELHRTHLERRGPTRGVKCSNVEASCSNFSSTGEATNSEIHSLKSIGGVPLPLNTSASAAAKVGGNIFVYPPSAHSNHHAGAQHCYTCTASYCVPSTTDAVRSCFLYLHLAFIFLSHSCLRTCLSCQPFAKKHIAVTVVVQEVPRWFI